MPDVVVCLWNIQNYASVADKYDGLGGANNAMRNSFIAQFCFQNDIDVLLIQEVQANATNALTDLVAQLNALYPLIDQDWAFSWCGSCIDDDHVHQATVPADLGMRTGARTEGYGVVWRTNQLARFRMIQGRFPIADGTGGPVGTVSPLNISERGRPTGQGIVPQAPGYTALGGYTTANPFPYRYNVGTGNYDLMATWPRLNYPTTGTLDPRQFRWANARRPVYVVLRLATNPATLCPVGAYHAPSNRAQSEWSAKVTGYARELYAVNNVDGAFAPVAALTNARTAVLGGDFNYEEDEWPGNYANFTALLRRAYDGGATCDEVPDHNDADVDRRTIVQLSNGALHDHPIVSANADDYLTEMIDLGFYRRLRRITGERVNLLDELINPVAGPYAGPIMQANALMAHLQAGVVAPNQRMVFTGPQNRRHKRDRYNNLVYYWSNMISGSWANTFVDWATARAQFGAGAITDARRAAEYMNIFVSDHLPLVITIPV